MIGLQTAFETTAPWCSRNPAIRPDDSIAAMVGVFQGRPFTVRTPDSSSQMASERRLSPARKRVAMVRMTTASLSRTVTLSFS